MKSIVAIEAARLSISPPYVKEKALSSKTFIISFLPTSAEIGIPLAIDFIIENSVIETLWKRGNYFKSKIETLIENHGLEDILVAKGYGPRWVIEFKSHQKGNAWEIKTYFQQESAKRGLLFTGSHNMSWAHDEDVLEKALSIYEEVIELLKNTLAAGTIRGLITGSVIQPVYRKP